MRNGVLRGADETVEAACGAGRLAGGRHGHRRRLAASPGRREALPVRPPGGGQVQAAGRVGVDPLQRRSSACTARDAELAHYQPYVPDEGAIQRAAPISISPWSCRSVRSRRPRCAATPCCLAVDVRDGQRTVMQESVEPAVSALDVDWPRERQSAASLPLRRPWILPRARPVGRLPVALALLTAEKAAAARRRTPRRVEGGHVERRWQWPGDDSRSCWASSSSRKAARASSTAV